MTSACLQIFRSKQQWVKGWKKLSSNDTIRTDQHQRSSVVRPVDTRRRHGSAQVLRQSFQCLQGTTNADEAVVKGRQISAQDFRRVSLGSSDTNNTWVDSIALARAMRCTIATSA